MKVKDLIEHLESLPIEEDWDVVLSREFIIDEKEELWGMLDIPIIGTVSHDEDKELRFLLKADDVKSCFHPGNVIFLDEE
tara:strand:+ start:354 stop:593 length:240 start_codon:yes stop_codon:yes gene_type:complete